MRRINAYIWFLVVGEAKGDTELKAVPLNFIVKHVCMSVNKI